MRKSKVFISAAVIATGAVLAVPRTPATAQAKKGTVVPERSLVGIRLGRLECSALAAVNDPSDEADALIHSLGAVRSRRVRSACPARSGLSATHRVMGYAPVIRPGIPHRVQLRARLSIPARTSGHRIR